MLYSLRFLSLSGGRPGLGGPASPSKDTDWTMLSSYDMLFPLAVGGGALLNYVHLVFPPALILSPELKNGTLLLILAMCTLSGTGLALRPSRTLKFTVGALLGLTFLAQGAGKLPAFQLARMSEALVENFVSPGLRFKDFSQTIARRGLHRAQNMSAF